MSVGDYDHLFKLVLVGEASVGKSSLLLRFTEDTFDDTMQATIGVDFKVKMIRVPSPGGAVKTVKATIWDTAGQERFRTLTSSYYRGAHGIILVYDVTRPETFTRLQSWLGEIETYCQNGGRDVVKLLVGNKTDMVHDRAVSTRDGEAFARSKGMLFLESSAADATNVKAVFEEVVAKILESPVLLSGTAPSTARPASVARLDAPKPPVAEASGGGGCC